MTPPEKVLMLTEEEIVALGYALAHGGAGPAVQQRLRLKFRAALDRDPDELIERVAIALGEARCRSLRVPLGWDVRGDRFRDYYRDQARAALAEIAGKERNDG